MTLRKIRFVEALREGMRQLNEIWRNLIQWHKL